MMRPKFPIYTPEDYFRPRILTAPMKGRDIRFYSKPGLPGWAGLSPAQALLAEAVPENYQGRLLILGCGHGALAVLLAPYNKSGRLALRDTSQAALQMSTLTLELNHVDNVDLYQDIELTPEEIGAYTTVALALPKGRLLARRWLAQANQALQPGGVLYLAGANDGGIQPVLRDAQELFGNAGILAYKKGSRVARLVKPAAPVPAPAWLDEPGIRPGSWLEVKVDIAGLKLQLASLPGVFSSDELDQGTRRLLEALPPDLPGSVLDLGCGSGVIGIWAGLHGASRVELLDVNLMAVAAARQNISRLGLSQAHVLASDGLQAVFDQSFRWVLTNPPFHTGREVDYSVTRAMIQQVRQVLEPGGQFWLVANRFIRYDRPLLRSYSRVWSAYEDGRFQVWVAE